MESIEASGKTIEEAVQQALTRLGKRRDEVEITVLQEPTRGAFGIGSKEARVRVTVRSGSPSSAAIITPEMADAILGPDFAGEEEYTDEDEFEDEDEEFLDEDEEEFDDEEIEDEKPAPFFEPAGTAYAPAGAPLVGAPPTQPGILETGAQVLQNIETTDEEMQGQEVAPPTREDVEITVDVLQHILRYMNIHATVQVRSTDPLTLNIHGINENQGLLIGRRGETLSALQLLVSLIVRHRTRHHMRIIVDAENYRERREENLRSLALRVAQQVRNYRRSIALEAMPPHERRIVHLALSDSKDISTESIGEGDARRVVISLKRPGR